MTATTRAPSPTVTRLAATLGPGALLVAVRSSEHGKRRAADILSAHGAHDLNFYGHHTIEALAAKPKAAPVDPRQ